MSVYLRGKGKYYQIKFVIDGIQHGPYSSKTDDKKLAEKIEDKMRGEAVQIGNNLMREKLTIAQVLSKYLDYAKNKQKPPNYKTTETAVNKLRAYLKPTTSAFAIGMDEINGYVNMRIQEGIHKITADKEIGMLRSAYNQRITAGAKIVNPTKGYSFATLKEKRARTLAAMHVLSPKDMRAFLMFCPPDVALFAVFAFNTGLRQGECLLVRWADINFEKGTLRPRRFKEGKNDDIPLHAGLLHILSTMDRLGLFVFSNPSGKATWTWYRKRFEKAREEYKACGGQHFRWHDFRHSFASFLLEKGYGLKTVADLLGHQTTTMTDQVYGHISNEHKRVAVQVLPDPVTMLDKIGDKIVYTDILQKQTMVKTA